MPASKSASNLSQRNIFLLSSILSRSDGGDQRHRERGESKQQQTEKKLLQDQNSTGLMKAPHPHRDRWSHFATDQWIWEIGAMLVSLASMVAIVLVLRLHEGRPLPTWPFSITINSLVSIFATIMKATMLVQIATGISQAKWHWFQQPHALNDVEIYDQASRGPWGALRLLWTVRWRHLSALGALVTVFALAIDPFVQQVTFPKLEAIPSPQNTTLSVLRTSTATLSNDAGINSIQRYIYSGLFSVEDLKMSPSCPSGNCTWDLYQTLAVCSQCVDITDKIANPTGDDPAQSIYMLPNGLSLGQVPGLDCSLNTSGKLPPVTLNQTGYSLANFSLISEGFATECSLYWCVNTYTAKVNNTIFTENLNSSYYNRTNNPPPADLSNTINFNLSDRVFYNISPPVSGDGAPASAAVNTTSAELNILNYDGLTPNDYIVASDPDLGEWLGPLLTGSASQIDTSGNAPSLPPSDVVALFQNSNLTQVSATFARVAQYLTVFYRNAANALDPETDIGPAQALGVAWEEQTVIVVRWEWLILPAALLALTVLFFGLSIVQSLGGRVMIWKSNTLALLFHGLKGDWAGSGDGDGEGLNHVAEMERKAQKLVVRLEDEGDGKCFVVAQDFSLGKG